MPRWVMWAMILAGFKWVTVMLLLLAPGAVWAELLANYGFAVAVVIALWRVGRKGKGD